MILIKAKEVRKKKETECSVCGAPICKNEYATELTYYSGGTMITEYACPCTPSYAYSPTPPRVAFECPL